ncbi:hypothetical protein [Actinacidiphila acidipaludis]|uniref:Uncharacterized protein n=1 Tax=Actinacidiphila acidipaludis TaxID=2873382 RepID=A0ABS7QL87_9ACTN|nr:hypothetical protein [Streptomyces acidipaludis]MBY8882554.1 hypothetical protein [Streptomyces acidipaludis]
MSGRERVLVRALWAVDRALGGQRPPGRLQRWLAARRPVRVAVTTGLCWVTLFLCCAGDLQRADLVVGLPSGVAACVLIGWSVSYERARQERLRRLGVWDGT